MPSSRQGTKNKMFYTAMTKYIHGLFYICEEYMGSAVREEFYLQILPSYPGVVCDLVCG